MILWMGNRVMVHVSNRQNEGTTIAGMSSNTVTTAIYHTATRWHRDTVTKTTCVNQTTRTPNTSPHIWDTTFQSQPTLSDQPQAEPLTSVSIETVPCVSGTVTLVTCWCDRSETHRRTSEDGRCYIHIQWGCWLQQAYYYTSLRSQWHYNQVLKALTGKWHIIMLAVRMSYRVTGQEGWSN